MFTLLWLYALFIQDALDGHPVIRYDSPRVNTHKSLNEGAQGVIAIILEFTCVKKRCKWNFDLHLMSPSLSQKINNCLSKHPNGIKEFTYCVVKETVSWELTHIFARYIVSHTIALYEKNI